MHIGTVRVMYICIYNIPPVQVAKVMTATTVSYVFVLVDLVYKKHHQCKQFLVPQTLHSTG